MSEREWEKRAQVERAATSAILIEFPGQPGSPAELSAPLSSPLDGDGPEGDHLPGNHEGFRSARFPVSIHRRRSLQIERQQGACLRHCGGPSVCGNQ